MHRFLKKVFIWYVNLALFTVFVWGNERADIIVAQDGSGRYRSIQEALNSIPSDNSRNVMILIKNGTYAEKLFIRTSHITLVGEDREKTRIVYAELRTNWTKLADNKPDGTSLDKDWGAAVVNIGDGVTDMTLANLTIHNNYGTLYGNHEHQFAIRGFNATRIALIDCNVIADGGDTVSLWNRETGMYYHSGCYFEGWVDYVCPRGWCYITDSRFYGHNLSASIWHDGSANKNQKFVVRNSFFDGEMGFPLGRHHRDAQIYFIDCGFSRNMADRPIYSPKSHNVVPWIWGPRHYFHNCRRDGGDFSWMADNLALAEGSPKPEDISAKWTFDGKWDPETTIRPLLGSESWSVRIARSFLNMHPDSVTYSDDPKSAKWDYEIGLMLEAMYRMWEHTRDSQYVKYIRKNLEHYIQEDGSIRTYKMDEFNLDKVAQGRSTLRMYQTFGDLKFKKAADTLRRQLQLHPRTSEGGFWHKNIYPHQMWLDGLYMAEPFYTMYAGQVGETTAFDDIAKQFLLIEKHHYDARTGLYFHGWDESKQQKWSDPKTGCSPQLWGRAIGWFAMSLVDVLELFPNNHPNRKDLQRILANLAESILKQRDDKTKLWYQVLDRSGASGNYIEASVSAMFTYAFAKGARLGYLPPKFANHASESFRGILSHLVSIDEKGVVHLNHVCKVSGLGGNPYRDGSYEYYVGEPQRTDDFKGYGPFLLSAIELERLGKISK